MEKEKQIEEMARALCGKSYNAEKGFCNKFDTECDFMCNAYMKSKRVYALGYRGRYDVARRGSFFLFLR